MWQTRRLRVQLPLRCVSVLPLCSSTGRAYFTVDPHVFSSFRASLSLGHGLCAANRNRVFHATWPWSRTTCRILDGDTAALMLQIQPSCNMSQHFTAARISQHEQSVTENGPPRQIQTGPPSPSHCQATICKAEQEFQKTATPIQTIGTYGILNEALVLRNLPTNHFTSLCFDGTVSLVRQGLQECAGRPLSSGPPRRGFGSFGMGLPRPRYLCSDPMHFPPCLVLRQGT